MANYVVSYSSKFKSASCTSLVAARQDVVERLFRSRVNAVATIKKDGKIVERIYPNRIPDDEDIVMPVFVAVDVASGRMRGVTADGTVYRMDAEETQAARRIVGYAKKRR